jgi:hypothetical protein
MKSSNMPEEPQRHFIEKMENGLKKESKMKDHKCDCLLLISIQIENNEIKTF